MFAVLCVISLGLGYVSGKWRQGSGRENAGNPEGKEETTHKELEFLKQGLVAHYPFNGNAKDESGNGNDGKVISATLAEDRHGESIRAYSFDGKDDVIEIPSSPSIKKTKAVSVSLWVKVNENQKAGPYGYNSFVGRWGGEDSDPQRHHSFWIGTHANKFITPCVGPHIGHNMAFRTEFQGNGWLHVVYAHDPEGAALFFNGEQVEERKNYSIKLREFDEPLLIGAGYQTKRYGVFLNGLIDDVSIYNRALSGEEVKALYGLEKPKGK